MALSTSSTISTSFLSSLPCLRSKGKYIKSKRASTTIMYGSRKGAPNDKNYHYGISLVDENMIVLRKRIHEMKIVKGESELPSDWMDWEKNFSAGYYEFICDAMALLQSWLMNTRPSLALGMALLVALSVPTSAVVVSSPLVEIIRKGVIASVHMG